MTSQPDKLFREKLEHFSTTAPHAAWSRIEAGLEKPIQSFWWLKIAAGITLISVATFLLWPDSTYTQLQLATTAKPVESSKNEVAKIETESKTSNTESVKQNNNQIKNTVHKNPTHHVVNSELLVAEVNEVTSESIAIEEMPAEISTPTIEDIESSQLIIYSAEEVNARFLKKELVAEATTEEKKTSGIQKLIGVAYTLASAEPALGNIRQRKDEVLALNFRDKKQGHN